MSVRKTPTKAAWGVLSAMCLLAMCESVRAQQADRDQSASASTNRSALDHADSNKFLKMEVLHPAEVRVNQPFEMKVQITNNSDAIDFHHVKIGYLGGDAISFGDARLEGVTDSGAKGSQKAENKRQADDKQQADKPQQDAKASQGESKRGSKEPRASAKGEKTRLASSKADGFTSVWTIDKIAAGESQTLCLQLTSKKEGEQPTCLALVSSTPVLCIRTRFVQPELEIVKKAPDKVHLCEAITYEYFVKNAGTGKLASFTVKDDLADGLETLEGEKQLQFQLDDGLEAGDRKSVV